MVASGRSTSQRVALVPQSGLKKAERHRFLSPAEMKEIKESAFGTGCAQERSDNFCDFINFCGTKEIKESPSAQIRHD